MTLLPGNKVRCRYNDSSHRKRYEAGDIGHVVDTSSTGTYEVWLDRYDEVERIIGFSVGELEFIERDDA